MNWVTALTIAAAALGGIAALIGILVARSITSGPASLAPGETLRLRLETPDGDKRVVVAAIDELSPDDVAMLFRNLTEKGKVGGLVPETIELHGRHVVGAIA